MSLRSETAPLPQPGAGRMKEITTELLFSVAKYGHSKPRNDEPVVKFIARQTHLHLNGKQLKSCVVPNGCMPLLKVLYLYDNEIEVLEGLDSLAQLTHLYAYNNQIHEIKPDIGALTQLRKLFLNGNEIASLAPLAPLTGLEELHAASQRLQPDETFDPAPAALGGMLGLRVLDLSGNSLRTTDGLGECRGLEIVNLSKNPLLSLASVAGVLAASPITDLDLRQCGVSESRQRLDAVIVSCPTIQTLNGRTLTAAERPYLQQLHLRGFRQKLVDGAPVSVMGSL